VAVQSLSILPAVHVPEPARVVSGEVVFGPDQLGTAGAPGTRVRSGVDLVDQPVQVRLGDVVGPGVLGPE
jgi:hypothetical protein